MAWVEKFLYLSTWLLVFLGGCVAEPTYPCGGLVVALDSLDTIQGCGDKLKVESLQDEPAYLTYSKADKTKHYALIMVGPDPKNETKYFIHWFLKSIPGSAMKPFHYPDEEEVEEGAKAPRNFDEKFTYESPNLRKGLGLQTYTFFVFEQTEAELLNAPLEARGGFDLDSFITENSPPVAVFQYEMGDQSDQ